MTYQEYKEWYARDLRRQLKESGLKQCEVAKAAGITEAAVSFYVHAKQVPSVYIDYRIRKAFRELRGGHHE